MGGYQTKQTPPYSLSSPPITQQKPISQADQAIVAVLQNKVKLEKSEKRLSSLSAGLTKAALDAKLAGDLDGAKWLLKVRAIKNEQLENVRRNMERLRIMMNDLDTAQQNISFAKVMESVTGALRAFESAMPAERVEKILTDYKDAKDAVEEVNQLFDHSLGTRANSIEDEIDAELATLGSYAISNNTSQMPVESVTNSSTKQEEMTHTVEFPSIPTHTPARSSNDLTIGKEDESRVLIAA
jgi:hypothetical protein